MNLALAVILLAGGLGLLWKGADVLVEGAVGLARQFGVSSLIIGLTVVAMGTSAPEVAASIAGVLRKTNGGDIALGNVFGSNIANLILVGGLVALIRPLKVQKTTLRREIPIMISVALLLWPFLYNAYLSRAEAAILLLEFFAFIAMTVYAAKGESKKSRLYEYNVNSTDAKYRNRDTKKSIFFVVAGLIGLALGAEMTVSGAVYIGREALGLSEGVIALSVISLGTSLPELVTCVVAAVRGEHGISVGNLVGSNIFNTVLVTGAAGLVKPFPVSPRFADGVDYWIMIAVSFAFAGAAIIGRRTIGRITGIVMLCGYTAYILYLFKFGL
ncbi:MAG: calcium/sodium antiporter [Sedimentisphaerales bacterium]